jgi:hypothetical protein
MTLAMLSMTMTFAENENATETSDLNAYDMSVNMRKLSVALDLKEDQMEAVAEIHHTFSAEMLFAAQASKDERQEMVRKAVTKDVKYMHYILDEKQYKKYLLLLNTTLNNRGLVVSE